VRQADWFADVSVELGGYRTISGTDATPRRRRVAQRGASGGSRRVKPLPEHGDPAASSTPRPAMQCTDKAPACSTSMMRSWQTRVTPSELSLGEGTTAQTKGITIANDSGAPVTYSLSHQTAAGTRGSTFAPILASNTATLAFSATIVTVAAGGSATVNVTITPNTSNALFDRSVYTGYIAVAGESETYRVPYAGFTGDYQSIQVLAAGGCSFGRFKRGARRSAWRRYDAGDYAARLYAAWTRQPTTSRTATIFR
jgi:hypothetical protein